MPSKYAFRDAFCLQDPCELTASAEADPAEVDSVEVDSERRPRALLSEFCLDKAECEWLIQIDAVVELDRRCASQATASASVPESRISSKSLAP